jgi:hypothetical protein
MKEGWSSSRKTSGLNVRWLACNTVIPASEECNFVPNEVHTIDL